LSKRRLIAAFALAAGATAALPTAAITNDWVVDNEHPYVGLVAFYDADGEFLWRCSGSLISHTKFVTAGHCTDTGHDLRTRTMPGC
jgi:V8-like Glu-specific endopeptidase